MVMLTILRTCNETIIVLPFFALNDCFFGKLEGLQPPKIRKITRKAELP